MHTITHPDPGRPYDPLTADQLTKLHAYNPENTLREVAKDTLLISVWTGLLLDDILELDRQNLWQESGGIGLCLRYLTKDNSLTVVPIHKIHGGHTSDELMKVFNRNTGRMPLKYHFSRTEIDAAVTEIGKKLKGRFGDMHGRATFYAKCVSCGYSSRQILRWMGRGSARGQATHGT